MTQNEFGSVTRFIRHPDCIEWELEHGRVRAHALSDRVLRFRVTPSDTFPEDRSYAIENAPKSKAPALTSSKETFTISTRHLRVLISRKRFSLSIQDSKGGTLSEGLPFTFTETSVTDSRKAAPGEDFYGLGERISPLGRRGYRTVNWNYDKPQYHNETDENLYSSFPVTLSLNRDTGRAFGYFLDTPYRSEFDLGYSDWDRADITARTPEFNLVLIAGTVRDIVREYTALTGRHPLPPIWALGYHQCRWSYMSTAEAMEIAKNFRKRKIPCDVMWYDIDYMDDFRVFTFDRARFGDMKAHQAGLKKMGFRSVVIVDPGVKVDEPGVYDVLDEGTQKRYFLRKPDGTDYVGKVWPGGTKFPDFSRPEVRQWWGRLHGRYYAAGIDGFWNDMNEIADFTDMKTKTVPPEVLMHDDGRWSTQDRMHNVYGLLEAKATYDGMLKQKPELRPFILTRAAYSGIQKYSAKWCGDNTSSWDHLRASIPQLINMGLSGVGFVGDDVGGFGSSNCSPELLARWTQAGVFYPFFRNHTAKSTAHQEPWRFGPEIERVCAEAIRLRYRLLPYFYQLFRGLHKTGDPVLRPLFWNNEDDPRAYAVADQMLLGDYLMAAPVVERGAVSRKVYFPEGTWFHYFTGQKYEGGREALVAAPLDSIPLFVRAGTVLPVMEPVDSTASMDPSALELEVFGNGTFRESYYEDDGLTNGYLKGLFAESLIALSARSLEFKRAAGSKIKTLRVRLFLPSFEAGLPEGFKKKGLFGEKTFDATRPLKAAW